MSSNTIAERSDRGSAAAKHRFSVLDFHRMAAAGILDEDDRVELIEGELFDMAPIGSKHASIVDLLVETFTLGARGRLLVRGQGPLQLSLHDEPMPDVLLLKPRADRYRYALPLPEDVLLVIEVADSTVARDRDIKIPIYGKHDIPEAWLIDLQRQLLTIYRQPCGEGYRVSAEISSGVVTPASFPDIAIGIVELFV